MSKWKYREVSTGSARRQNGMVLEHRFVAEQVVGRPLKRKEVVHHIDNDRTNNVPGNLMVFASQGDHARFHAGGIAKRLSDSTYETSFDKPTRSCLACGTETTNDKYCSDGCYSFSIRRTARPSKEELEELVKTVSMVQVGKRFGVSDNSIRKWCRAYGIVVPKGRVRGSQPVGMADGLQNRRLREFDSLRPCQVDGSNPSSPANREDG